MRGQVGKVGRLAGFAAILFFLIVSAPYPARAGSAMPVTYWVGGDGDWNPGSWSNGLPQAGYTAYILTNNTVTVDSYDQSQNLAVGGGSTLLVTDGGNLQLASASGQFGALGVGASDSSGNAMATVNQTGGTVRAGLVLNLYGAQGTSYNLYDGSLYAGSESVYGGNTFNQSGGTHHVGGPETIGTSGYATAPATYNLSGGSHTVDGDLTVNYGSTYNLSGSGSLTVWGNENLSAGNLIQTGGSNTIGLSLFLGTYELQGGTLSITGYVSGPSGNINIDGGTLVDGWQSIGEPESGYIYPIGAFNVGWVAGTTGTYTLDVTNLFTASNESIGYQGTGTFNQTAGTNTVTNTLYLGSTTGSSGTYNLTGGTLDVQGYITGGAGTNALNIDGGTLTDNWKGISVGNFNVGYEAGTFGNFTQSSKVIQATTESIGYYGTGTFNQTGGMNYAGSLYLGGGPDWAGTGSPGTGSGTYNLSGGTLVVYNNASVGYNGSAAFYQTGGTAAIGGNLYLGGGPDPTGYDNPGGGSGIYVLSNGTLAVGTSSYNPYGTGSIYVGYNGNGIFSQTGGTLTTNNLFVGGSDDGISGTGTYDLQGGTVVASPNIYGAGGNTYVGYNGTFGSALNQSGGTLTTSTLYVGGGMAPYQNGFGSGSGTYNLSGGTLIVTPDSRGNGGSTYVGYAYGSGTFNQSGGAFTTGSLYVGYAWQGQGTYNLRDGTLNVSGSTYVGDNYSTGTFNQGAPVSDGAGGWIATPGGSHTTTNLYIGGSPDGTPGTGAYTIVNGTLNVNPDSSGKGGNIYVGYNDLSWSGSTFTQGYDSVSRRMGDGYNQVNLGGNLYLGANNGQPYTTDTYNLYTGTLAVAGNSYVGYSSGGVFNQGLFVQDADGFWDQTSGGTHTTGNLYLGGSPDGASGSGTYNLVNGTLTVKGSASIGFNDQSSQGSTFNEGYDYNAYLPGQSSVISLAVRGNLYLGGGFDGASGNTGSGTGTYNLSRGELLVSGSTYVGYEGTGYFNQGTPVPADAQGDLVPTDGGSVETSDLYLGGSPDNGGTYGTGTYTLENGNLTVDRNAYIGYNGSGTFNQGYDPISGQMGDGYNTVNVWGNLYIGGGPDTTGGSNPGSGSGTYNLATGTLTVTGATYVGYSGVGYFNQTGGINYAGNLYIGGGPDTTGHKNPGSGTGTYNLATGTLTAGATYVGYYGTGFFNQGVNGSDGGTYMTGNLYVGGGPDLTGLYSAGKGTGTYNLARGRLTVYGIGSIGNGGTGTFNQSGGSVSVGSGLTIGENGGTGTYSQTGGSVTLTGVTGDLTIGASGGTGTYSLTGGTLNVGGTIYVGYDGTGALNQSTGNLTTVVSVGDQASGLGTYTMTGGQVGAVTVGNAATGRMVSSSFQEGGRFYQSGGTVLWGADVGAQTGSTGHYEMTGGTISGGDVTVGDSGTGTFNQSGSAAVYLEALWVGYGSGSSGTYNLSGNTVLAVNPFGNGIERIGRQGTAVFNQSGGTHTVYAHTDSSSGIAAGDALELGSMAGGSGTYNLSGGTLNVSAVTPAGGPTVKGSLIVGGNGYTTATPAGTGVFNQTGGAANISGDLIIGNNGGTGTYNLTGGSLSAANIVNNGTFSYSGGSVTGNFQNNGHVTVTGGTALTPNDFAGPVTNYAGSMFTISGGANVLFDNTLTNNLGATFTVSQSTVTFMGNVTNNGTWITDPSTIVFNGNFTNTGSLSMSSDDTYEFTGFYGAQTIDLGGKTITIGTLELLAGAHLCITDGTLIYTNLDEGSGAGITTGPSTVPAPASILIFAPCLAGLAALRRRFKK